MDQAARKNSNTELTGLIKNSSKTRFLMFSKNEKLYSEGEHAAGIYCIESGFIKLTKNEPAEEDRLIYLAAEGDVLGLHCVVNGHPYAATATAVEETYVCYIAKEDFMEIIRSDNRYKILVMQSLCSRIGTIENHMASMNAKTSDERLADTLLLLINKFGIDLSEKTLNVSLSMDELASYTCTSKSYLKKIASEFSAKGLASISQNKIKIFDINGIKSIANSV